MTPSSPPSSADASPVFLEVDAEDRAFILARYPHARIYDRPLQGVFEECADAEILSCFVYSTCTAEVLSKFPRLRLLCTRSVGYDHIDTEACAKRGIHVCNVPDYGSHVIAEHVFALLLSATRHIREADARVEQGNFDYRGLRGMALKGKTVGVIGTGKIGRTVCMIAHGFGMNVLALDACRTLELEEHANVRYVPFDFLLEQSDVITLHVPATKDTEHMINGDAIAKMKDGVVLINTARGSLIDTLAMVEGLKKGKFSHVLLDVLEHEKNFESNKELIAFSNVITTPHIAFFADDSMQKMYSETFDSIAQFLAGSVPSHRIRPVHIVCDLPAYKKA